MGGLINNEDLLYIHSKTGNAIGKPLNTSWSLVYIHNILNKMYIVLFIRNLYWMLLCAVLFLISIIEILHDMEMLHIFFVVSMNKLLNIQSSSQWFETKLGSCDISVILQVIGKRVSLLLYQHSCLLKAKERNARHNQTRFYSLTYILLC